MGITQHLNVHWFLMEFKEYNKVMVHILIIYNNMNIIQALHEKELMCIHFHNFQNNSNQVGVVILQILIMSD
jgi:hypothetical protein